MHRTAATNLIARSLSDLEANKFQDSGNGDRSTNGSKIDAWHDKTFLGTPLQPSATTGTRGEEHVQAFWAPNLGSQQ